MLTLRTTFIFCIAILLSGCSQNPGKLPDHTQAYYRQATSEIVACLLPSQVRMLGSRFTYLSPRRPVKISQTDCIMRGGQRI